MEAFVLKWETLRSTGYVGLPLAHLVIQQGHFKVLEVGQRELVVDGHVQPVFLLTDRNHQVLLVWNLLFYITS